MKILIINPNTNVETTEQIQLVAERAAANDTVIECVTAPFGVKTIKTLEDLPLAVEAVLSIIDERAPTVDAVVIAAFSDPGLSQAKARVSIPIVGIAEAAMLKAASLSDRFSIVTMGQAMVDYLHERAVEYGVGAQLARVRILPWIVGSWTKAHLDSFATECRAAIKLDGAGAVIIGGGPLSGFAEHINQSLKLPILDGTVCAVHRAEQLAGTTWSKICERR